MGRGVVEKEIPTAIWRRVWVLRGGAEFLKGRARDNEWVEGYTPCVCVKRTNNSVNFNFITSFFASPKICKLPLADNYAYSLICDGPHYLIRGGSIQL